MAQLPTASLTTMALILVLSLLVVVSFVSWKTPLGESVRYYYYTHAIAAIGIVITVIAFLFSTIQRRESENKFALEQTFRINQRYWVDLERYFSNHAASLNRLYKQMWPDDPDIQALPNVPLTRKARLLEIHAANMILGMINNMNATVAYDKRPDEVAKAWESEGYRTWFSALKNWMRSDIIYERYLANYDLYSGQMHALIDIARQARQAQQPSPSST
jgi:hypothetical protein